MYMHIHIYIGLDSSLDLMTSWCPISLGRMSHTSRGQSRRAYVRPATCPTTPTARGSRGGGGTSAVRLIDHPLQQRD